MEVTCESYNFGPNEEGDHVCELSDSDGVRDPDDLVTRQDFLYRATKVSWRGSVEKSITWICWFFLRQEMAQNLAYLREASWQR